MQYQYCKTVWYWYLIFVWMRNRRALANVLYVECWLHSLLLFRLLAPGQVARSKNVYSYKFILDSVEQNHLLDINLYRLVCIGTVCSWRVVCPVQLQLFRRTYIEIITESKNLYGIAGNPQFVLRIYRVILK